MTGYCIAFVIGAWAGFFIAALLAAGKDKNDENY